jgi:DNA polymerase-3 subunit alpha
MSKFDIIRPPSRFVSFHGHSGFSTFDGLGYPADHIAFVTSDAQGMDAWALTDHGNGNGLAHARSAALKVQKKGKKYRQLYGVEFYFVPSLKQWSIDYEAHKQSVKDAKTAAEMEKRAKTPTDIDADPGEEEDEQGGHVVEDENETKTVDVSSRDWQRRYHLVAVAKNQNGLANIFRLVKASYKYGFYRYPRIDFELLQKYGSDIIWSTACLGGIYSGKILLGEAQNKSHDEIMTDLENLTDRFQSAVGNKNFYLELQFNKLEKQHTVNKYLIDLSKKTGVPLVSTCDSHYPDPSKWQARELYKKLGWMGAKLDGAALPKFEDLKCELYPKNASQMWDEYKQSYEQYEFYKGSEELVRDSIERTHDITWNECEDTWVDTKPKLPKVDTPEKSAFKQLTELVMEGLKREGLDDKPAYVERAKYELGDIKYLKCASYFITMYKVFNLAKEKTLFGSGRGSGAGSLVNFLLGITQIDPIPYGLLWSRFLGRHRVSFPDIDTDAGDRDVLIDAARTLFGDDAVIPVSNFNTLKLKSLVKDIAKIYGVPFEEVNEMTGPLQDEVMPLARDEDQEKSVFVLKHEDCMKYSPKYTAFMEKYPEVAAHVETLFMQNRSVGRHAGGVLLADPDDLAANMPIIGVRGELQTPWTEGMNFRNLEDNGFLKFDFLGLTLLKDVENCISRILVKQGNPNPTFLDVREFFDKHLNCRYVKQDDPVVWKHVYQDGAFVSVFQMTAEGARKFCKAVKPTKIEDLTAITAIYRPGPLKANVHNLFVEARKKEHIDYPHPIIEQVLGPTRNFVVYQEQFMLLAEKLGGFTPGEADQLRKTLVKKSSEKEIAKQKFIEGAQRIHGVGPEVTEPLWQTIDNMSVYCFNKSHSLAYAIDSYYAAWLHTHYEKEWLATALQSENTNPKGLAKTISEIKALGYSFSKIDVNYSGKEWQYSEEAAAFVPPLSSVKGIGSTAVEEIMQLRPYKNLQEMLYDNEGNWRHSKMNKTALSALCKIDALSSLEDFNLGRVNNHKQLLMALTDDKNYEMLRRGLYGLTASQLKKKAKAGEKIEAFLDVTLTSLAEIEDWSREEKILMCQELTQSVDSDLLFPPAVMSKIAEKQVPKLHDIEPGTEGIGWFCAAEVQVKKTKNGKIFYRIKAIDDEHRSAWLRAWGTPKEEIKPYTLWLAQASNDSNWGFSTSVYKMRALVE